VCKDDRDRLYALKSLLPENSDLVIMPDYEKKVVEVFTDLALQQLQHGQIEILYQAGLGRNLASAFHGVLPYTFPISEPVPSWVPDYRKGISYVGWTPYFGDDFRFSQIQPQPLLAHPLSTILEGSSPNPHSWTSSMPFFPLNLSTMTPYEQITPRYSL
jgi:hypothetical protein